MRIKFNPEFEVIAFGGNIIYNQDNMSIKLSGCVIESITTNANNGLESMSTIGSRELNFSPTGQISISGEIGYLATKVEYQNKPYNFKDLLKKELTIEDLFKIINKKIKG